MKASHVYILRHASLDVLKIGKADDIIRRASCIGLDEFDLTNSVGLRAKSAKSAIGLEKSLHTAFARYRLKSGDATAMGIPLDGATEWFSGDCSQRLDAFLETNADLFSLERVAVEIPRNANKPKRDYKRLNKPNPVVIKGCATRDDLELWKLLYSAGAPDEYKIPTLTGTLPGLLSILGKPDTAQERDALVASVDRLQESAVGNNSGGVVLLYCSESTMTTDGKVSEMTIKVWPDGAKELVDAFLTQDIS